MDDKLKQIQKLLDAAEGNLHSARNLMREVIGMENAPLINHEEKAKDLSVIEEGRIVEGVYNGESMVGPDGKEYQVPANYASKSKLVEGDVLKLTIADDGSFIYKQIRPIERRKTLGTLSYANGTYSVNADGKTYKVLQASVTYYKGEPGDQVTLILPKDHESTWAAIENIVSKLEGESAVTEETSTETPAESPTDDKAAEESTTGPEIEFPASPSDDTTTPLEKQDQDILNNLATEEAPSNEPTASPAEETKNKEDDNEEPGSEGIKELEI